MRPHSPTRYPSRGLVLIAALAASPAVLALDGEGPLAPLTRPVDSRQVSHQNGAPVRLPWSEFVFQGLWLLDSLQTSNIAAHPRQWQETAGLGLLGSHPSQAQVAGYFAAGAVLHAAVTYELVSQDVPRPIVLAWEAVTIGAEAGYVGHNFSIGIGIKF